MRKKGEPHTLLDIREIQEIEFCSIEGSLNIPMSCLGNNLDKLPKEEPIIVMCHIGGRSIHVVNWLQGNGYLNALNLQGGIKAWAEEIDNDMPIY